jgi:ATPase subunit of ABC transporter with duplicated ATPase domains
MLLQSAKGDATKLEQLQKRLERLRRGVTVRCFSSQAQKQLQELLGISEHACRLLSQQRILKSLAFQDMHGRFETVPDAHKKTFEWLLDDTAPNQGVEDHSSTRELFIDWLSSGKDIFHISGKLGSGKSTLMKYLCGERRTTTELQKWAGMSLSSTYLTGYECSYIPIRWQETHTCKLLLLETRHGIAKVSSRPFPVPPT